MNDVRDQVVEVRGIGPGRAAERLVQLAATHGYAVAASGPNRFRLARTSRPMWANVVALVLAPLFGLGLFFLLVKRTEACEAVILEDRSGVRINLAGAVNPTFFVALHDDFTNVSNVATYAPTPTAFAPQSVPTVTPQFVPPGMPVTANGYVPAPQLIEAADIDRTMTVAQLASMRNMAPPLLRFPDGRTLPVGSGLVIGRNPEADVQLSSAHLVPFDDPSLSKTHATFGPTARGIWVQDHHSTNGTSVKLNGSTTLCQPGARVEVPIGGAVLIGEVYVTIVEGPR